MTRILVAEFLLANAAASRTASESMLNEAAAMLTAVVTDLALASDTSVTVLLNAEINPLSATLPNVQVIRAELRPETLQVILRGEANQPPYDAVLLIAPECDGVLVSLLKIVQEPTGLQARQRGTQVQASVDIDGNVVKLDGQALYDNYEVDRVVRVAMKGKNAKPSELDAATKFFPLRETL